ncbi:MAG: bacillithiol biosynthesis cysteine-adding enzyme BshC [Imperialibacter sp.]|uniref:bacillithiol biosynthesis cysteine-adding enzyme BshC n=1 Tax=Imperialibacter sp. TaxID=2038411 RepID=UPI0032EC3D0E
MRVEKISLGETGQFSPIFLEYLAKNESLKDFYQYYPSVENAEKQIALKKAFPKKNRLRLEAVLNEQYGALDMSPKLRENIHALSEENTFTVTTGHQLNIFTGPLYFIYKIVTVIDACKQLKAKYPDYHFVPVYWAASEDHDFEEISYCYLYGKKYTWETDQKGAVGRFMPHSLSKVLDEMPDRASVFEKAYLDHNNLADAVRYYVNELFGHEGLVMVDGDHPDLKRIFAPIIKQDIEEHASNRLVEETTKKLDDAGFKTQVHAREINFFYLNSIHRDRIIEEDGIYKVNNTDLSFTREELWQLLEKSPEKFSPNVIMRPVYQEAILPNLAYIGGPAEVAYWLQFKAVFDHYQLPFPMLMPRNFGLVVQKSQASKIEKLGLKLADLFMEGHEIRKKYVRENSENDLLLGEEKAAFARLMEQVKAKAVAIDKTLDGYMGKQETRLLQEFEGMEKKLQKAEENNQAVAINQIESIKEKLFPGGSLQERHDNFLNFYLTNPAILDEFLNGFDAFDFSFHIFMEE